MTDSTNKSTVVTEPTQSDSTSTLSRRSSSQASHTSSESKRLKSQQLTKKNNATKPSPKTETDDDSSLTSFPSLSPEAENSHARPQEYVKPTRTVSQRLKARKATLAGLTGGLPLTDRSNALFDDSPRLSHDIPGSLHLSSDEHIERLIARVGAVKLIRQYAQDMAQRDAEISTLRVRADERERELKKLLREADIPSADVEKRLLRLERTVVSTGTSQQSTPNSKRGSTVSIDSLINEAMTDIHPADVSEPASEATVTSPKPPPTLSRASKSTVSVSQLSNENITTHSLSQTTNMTNVEVGDLDSTIRQRQTSSNGQKPPGLQSIFTPPSNTTSYFIGGPQKPVKKGKAIDEVSIRSNQSVKSNTSWTRIFGGRTQPSRSRASSIDQSTATKQDETLAVANTKVRMSGNKAGAATSTSAKQRPQVQRTTTATRTTSGPNHTRKDSNASSLPPTVELDSMIESSQLPPTMANHNTNGLLLDRFGFIYDRKRKRKYSRANRHTKQKPSISESLANFRHHDVSATSEHPRRPMTPASLDDDASKKTWQDYLLPSTGATSTRPRELLAHTPSAGAVVTVNTAGAEGTITPPRFRDSSISVSSAIQKVLPATVSVVEAKSSTTTATSQEGAHDADEDANDISASKALLEQLTELHDNLQAERTVKWNDFLRRVRAERASTSTERTANNAPEADLVNGELVGIATLGRSSKNKAKYMHFKALVLAGIPVSLRPKIWAECSGASSLRVPGYYDDLVNRSESDDEIEADIAQQIRADVKRTLRDNVFFRDPDAPGVRRLEELLRAYSLHNPRIGYCQGMNLITASLLLICATSEDCFWLLVVIIDYILPSGYFDQSLLVARADQLVLCGYVAEVLPKLDAKLQDLGVELEACTFHWFLSLYTGVLTGGEALYRTWDVVLCLNSSDSAPLALQNKSAAATLGVENYLPNLPSNTPTTPSMPAGSMDQTTVRSGEHDGTSSPFLFQLSLALLKLNEEAILALESAAQVYTYLNHNMTAHNITIDALVNASEMLRSRIKRSDVLERRKKAVESLV